MEKPCCGCAPLIRGPAMRISSGRSIGWTRWPGWFRHEQPPNAAAVSMAEREGFEPSIEFPLYTLSKRAPSTARPSLLSVVSSSLTHVEQIISQPQIGLRLDLDPAYDRVAVRKQIQPENLRCVAVVGRG